MIKPTIYVLSPDHANPVGGVKQLYRHVDILNSNGFNSLIVHQREGFRVTWFTNETPVSSVPELQSKGKPGPNDYLVVPEIFWPGVMKLTRGIQKVIFNQGAFHTLQNISLDQKEIEDSYLHEEILATLCVSDHNIDYVQYAFPGMRVSRVHYGFDPSLFYYTWPKKRQIAFMVSKNFRDVLQIVNMLKIRKTISDFEFAIIKDKTESEVAEVLRESAIYLSFGTEEGFSMPPAEAMACGCIVVGYHGWGGREYFRPEFSYPVQIGDIVGFAATVEKVAELCRQNPALIAEMGENASRYISHQYSMDRERQDVIGFWTELTRLNSSVAKTL